MAVKSSFHMLQVIFNVSDIRSRLSKEIEVPKRNFTRDPEDPSGTVVMMS